MDTLLLGDCNIVIDHLICFSQINESGLMNQIPLLVAAGSGCCEIVQLLLDKGARVNVQVTNHTKGTRSYCLIDHLQRLGTLSTPLHEAAAANSLDIVGCLLEAGADVSVQNNAGEVPFDCSTSIEVRK